MKGAPKNGSINTLSLTSLHYKKCNARFIKTHIFFYQWWDCAKRLLQIKSTWFCLRRSVDKFKFLTKFWREVRMITFFSHLDPLRGSRTILNSLYFHINTYMIFRLRRHTIINHFYWSKKSTHLNFINSRWNIAVSKKSINLFGVKIGDTDGFCQTESFSLLHTLPGFQVVNVSGSTVSLKNTFRIDN